MGLCLQGRHVRLREVRDADAAFILSIRLDPRLARFLNPVSDDIGRQREFIRGYRKQEGECYFIIEDRSGRQVGTIRIADIVADAFFTGSFAVRADAGVFAAMEAYLMVARHGFEVLGKTAMRGWVMKENRAHIRFLGKLGAVVIGEEGGQFLFEGARERVYAAAGRYSRFLGRDWRGVLP
jgi:RimJ/RimL family protein N-acetyltransferase